MYYWQIKTLDSLPLELWQPIPEYEDSYHISNLGRIKSFKKLKFGYPEKIISQTLDPHGYPTFVACKNKHKKRFLTHRLVALVFVDNPDNKPMVNHKNGIRGDSNYTNLEYVTCSENHLHAYKELNRKASFTGRIGKLHPRSKSIICLDTNECFESINQAAIKLKLSAAKINLVCHGHRNTHGGMRFKFLK